MRGRRSLGRSAEPEVQTQRCFFATNQEQPDLVSTAREIERASHFAEVGPQLAFVLCDRRSPIMIDVAAADAVPHLFFAEQILAGD